MQASIWNLNIEIALHLCIIVLSSAIKHDYQWTLKIAAQLTPLKMFPDEIMLETFLSSADIAAIRHSWGLAKEAAPFEVHGPAFYQL